MKRTVAFVLGGGGHAGAAEVGMLHALLERDLRPDLIVGTEIELQDVGAPFEGGGYHVTRMCHTYDLRLGHRTRFDAERGWIGNFQ